MRSPENTPRLFDLIHVEDERLRAAFYFVLSDTLVADDLNHASRVAYGAKRWRVVTLRGELIEIGGTMSGGGTRQFRGKMAARVKVRSSAAHADAAGAGAPQQNLDELRQRTQDMQTEVNYLQEVQGRLERECGELQQRLQRGERELQALRREITGLEQHLPRQQQQLEQQRAVAEQTRADATRVAELQERIDTNKQSLADADANTRGLREQVADAKRRIAGITTEMVGAVEKRIADGSKQCATLKKNVMKLQMEISTSERNVSKSQALIDRLAEDIKVRGRLTCALHSIRMSV